MRKAITDIDSFKTLTLSALFLLAMSLNLSAQSYPQIEVQAPNSLIDTTWDWLSEEIGKYVPKSDSTGIDYFVYDSHPQYKVSNEYYVFDADGRLVYVHNWPFYAVTDRNVLISQALLDDFEKDKYNSGLDVETLNDVKAEILNIAGYNFAFDGYGNTTSPTMNYISKLYEAEKYLFNKVTDEKRTGTNSFVMSFARHDTIVYQLHYNFVDEGNYKVKREIKIEKTEIILPHRNQTDLSRIKKSMDEGVAAGTQTNKGATAGQALTVG